MSVCVFGGTGYLGRRIVRGLAAAGWPVRILARRAPADPRPAVRAMRADLRDESAVAGALHGARAAVNAVGLYVERGDERFEAVHVDGAARLARRARAAGLEALVHVSGIGVDPASPSAYVRARYHGEARVRELFPEACILRPSVLFGPGDAFLRLIDAATRLSPVLPLVGRGDTALQPVHVDDVAEAAARALADPGARGAVLELGGPEVLRFREVAAQVLAYRRRRRLLLPLPKAAWLLLARLLALTPSPPLTRDQVHLLDAPNVVAPERDGFARLGIAPRSLAEALGACLEPAAQDGAGSAGSAGSAE